MANRLLLNYDRSNKFHAEEVEKLLKVPSGSHASAVVIEEVPDALRAAGVHSEAERILGEARGTPAGEVLRSFREGFGRLTTGARLVIRSLGYDPALGGTGNGLHAAAILAAQGATLEQVRLIRENDIGLSWG